MKHVVKCATVPIRWFGGRYCVLLVFSVFVFPVFADSRISILDFEVKDLTMYPRVKEEKERAASMKPMLQEILEAKGGYELVNIDSNSQNEANKGTGYLFDHHDIVAKLGQEFGTDLVLMGRVHKASHLFVYFMAHLVDVKTQQLIGNYVVEVKGPQKKLTVKGLESLAEQIDKTIRPHTSSR